MRVRSGAHAHGRADGRAHRAAGIGDEADEPVERGAAPQQAHVPAAGHEAVLEGREAAAVDEADVRGVEADVGARGDEGEHPLGEGRARGQVEVPADADVHAGPGGDGVPPGARARAAGGSGGGPAGAHGDLPRPAAAPWRADAPQGTTAGGARCGCHLGRRCEGTGRSAVGAAEGSARGGGEARDDLREAVVVADVAREDDVGHACGGPVHRLPQGDEPGEHRAPHEGAADAEPAGGHVVGGDPALGHHEARRRLREDARDELHDGRGDRAGQREAAARVVAGDELAAGLDQDVTASEAGDHAAHGLVEVAGAALVVDEDGHGQLDDLGAGPGLDEPVALAGGQARVGADDHETAAGGGGPDVDALDGGGGVLADARAHEGRAGAVDEGAALALEADARERRRLQVPLRRGVHRDDGAGGGRAQQVDDGVRPAADGGEVEHDDVAGRDGAAGLLGDPLGQPRAAVAEGGVRRELRLPDGHHPPALARPVDAVDGDAAGVGEGRHEEHEVGAAAPGRLQLLGDDVGLEREVPAQRGVAAGEEGHALAPLVGRGQGGAHDLAGAPLGRRRVEAARVRQDVQRGAGLVHAGPVDPGLVRPGPEGPGEVVALPAGQDGQVRHGLGAGGVVVQHHQRGPRAADGLGHLGRRHARLGGRSPQHVVQLHRCAPSSLVPRPSSLIFACRDSRTGCACNRVASRPSSLCQSTRQQSVPLYILTLAYPAPQALASTHHVSHVRHIPPLRGCRHR